jgi:hypothetical protein
LPIGPELIGPTTGNIFSLSSSPNLTTIDITMQIADSDYYPL